MSGDSGTRLSRLLALVPWLVQHNGTSMDEAAAHFGISVEQLEQDLWLLVCCGLPGHGPDQLIDIQFWDDDGRIDVIDPQTLSRPLRLTVQEATSLLVGLRILAQVPGDHDRGVLASVTAKLEQASGEAMHDGERIVIVDEVSDEVRTAIEMSLRQGTALDIVYLGATNDEVTHRRIDPSALVHRDGRTYLQAWCRSAEAWRTFRLDRILEAAPSGEAARVPEPEPAPRQVAVESGQRVEIGFSSAGRWLVDLWGGTLTVDSGEGPGRAWMQVGDIAWLRRALLGAGGQVWVVSPAPLRERIRCDAEAALAAYEAAPGS